MAAYKRDINLFKAAGGTVSKGKKMPLTKKLLIIMVVITIVLGAVIGVLMYLNGQLNASLKVETTRKEAYDATKMVTVNSLKEYNEVSRDLQNLEAIEFYNELNNYALSCLSDQEIDAVAKYFERTGIYSTDFYFDDIIDNLCQEVGLAQYKLDENTSDYAATLSELQYVYSALCYMKKNEDLFKMLYGQIEDNDSLWYCYFRGQFIAVLKGGQSSDLVLTLGQLTDGNNIYSTSADNLEIKYSPFMSVLQNVGGAESIVDLNCAYAFNLRIDEETTESYSVFCITRKTVVERALQTIEDCISHEKNTDSSYGEDATFDYSYKIINFSYDQYNRTIEFTINMRQGKYYGIDTICTAFKGSDFFSVSQSFSYPTTDREGDVSVRLVFQVVKKPFDIMADAIGNVYFIEED